MWWGLLDNKERGFRDFSEDFSVSLISKGLIKELIKLSNDDEYDEASYDFLRCIIGHDKSKASAFNQEGYQSLRQARQEG